MSELEEVYRDVILDHYRRPRNFGSIDDYPLKKKGVNPLCGDEIFMGVRVEFGRLTAIKFRGRGCAVCMAASSILSEHMRGESCEHIGTILDNLLSGLKHGGDAIFPAPLEYFTAIAKYPSRHKCISLPVEILWDALPKEQIARPE